MILLIALLIYNTGVLSEALGTGLSQRRKMKKKKGRVLQYILASAVWSIAILLLVSRKGGLFGQHPLLVITNSTIDKAGSQPLSTTPPAVQTAVGFQSLFQSNWFYAAFFGLLVVCSVIVARSIIFSWKEGKNDLIIRQDLARAEAVASVEDAFRILRAQPELDPRLRIINCYQRMVLAAQQQGANITSDQTARELEAAIHNMLGIKGPSMRDLTNIFEEARYSLHPITEDDAAQAQQYLLNIAQEMSFTLSI